MSAPERKKKYEENIASERNRFADLAVGQTENENKNDHEHERNELSDQLNQLNVCGWVKRIRISCARPLNVSTLPTHTELSSHWKMYIVHAALVSPGHVHTRTRTRINFRDGSIKRKQHALFRSTENSQLGHKHQLRRLDTESLS